MRARRSDRWIALGLLAAALAVRWLLLARQPFDGLYGQDAFAYYDYAVTLRANLLQNHPVPAFFWPIGFPLQLVLMMSVLGVSPSAAQLVSVIAGALIAPLTYALAREVLGQGGRRAALIAGLIVAAGGQLLISSLSIMSDAAALMWATASAWLVVRYARTRQSTTLLLAVIALSAAVVTRWAMTLLAAPWALAGLAVWRAHWPQIGLRRAAGLILVTTLIAGVVVGGPLASGSHTGDLQVVGWEPLNALRRDVINRDGVFHYDLPMGLYYAQPLAHPAFIFPLFLPFLLIGLGSMRRLSVPARCVLIGWPLIVYGFLIGIAWQNPRFMLPLLPPLAVWVAVGIDRVGRIDRRWRWMTAAIVVVGLSGSSAWGVRVVDNFIDRKNADLAVVGQLDRLVPPDGTLLAFGLTATARHYSDRRVIELFNLDEVALGREVQSGAPLYLLIDPINVETQWADKSPALNYHWLRAHARLEEVADMPPYRLFRVVRS